MQKHEDNRRLLIEWIENAPIKSCKVIVAKGDTIVGDHYHLKKDEYFYLLSGQAEYQLDDGERIEMTEVVYAPRGMRHTFHLAAGSILLSCASEPFDINDEIK